MKCYKNFSQVITLQSSYEKDGRKLNPEDLTIISNGAIVFDDNKIYWVGNSNSIPDEYSNTETYNYTGHIVTPEIVDSHTHLVFGGDRSFEYSMRLNGADYQAIADSGGGILATMEKTITSSEHELFDLGVERVNRIHSYGVGTIEVKSGYGLTVESERKITRVIAKLKDHFAGKVQILNTFLAAHAVPGGFTNSRDYINKVVLPLMTEFSDEKLIDFVDIFHEKGYFDIEDSKLLFNEAVKLKLKLKIHADEFNDNKGAVLAADFGAKSADHLLCTEDDGIKALANSDTVATLLPGTAYFLGKPLADARKFLDQGCKVSLASDYNPGSCHCDNLVLLASLCAKNMKFNIAEIWSAITLNAAHALDLREQGAIVENLKPRFSIFKCNSIDEITYSWGRNFSTNQK
ncbi:MAG: imidazolonepropionase [Bacteriovoracaceae bacterium]|jgi:imidazolonepropionase